LFILAATVVVNKLINRQVASTDSDHNCVTLNLHENPFAMVPVNARAFALEMHPRSLLKGFCVDKVRQHLIDSVVFERLVDEHLVFDGLLHICQLLCQSLNLVIFALNMLQQHQVVRLRHLTFLFHFKEVIAALVELSLQVSKTSNCVLKLVLKQISFFGSCILLCTQRAHVNKFAVDEKVFSSQRLDYVIFSLDLRAKALVFILDCRNFLSQT
jgi:hypothetical protein